MHRAFLPQPPARGRHALALAAVVAVLGCSTSDILNVDTPDIIPTVTSASGAIALKNGVILRLEQATNGIQGPDALFVYGGLLADEYRSGDTFVQRNDMDQRIFDPTNTFLAGPFRSLNRVRVEGLAAINALQTYAPTPQSNIGLMYALTAYSLNLAGETYCNGIPVSGLSGTTIVYGDPLPVDSVFGLASVAADSALAYQPGPDSARVRQFAAIVKGRALLNRGQYAAAASVVSQVATAFHYDVTYSANTSDNQIWALNTSAKRYFIGDREGGSGLPFYSANDPRVIRSKGGKVFDSSLPDTAILQGLWGRFSAVPIAAGIEARLIEAEASLQAGNTAAWLTTLNTLRANNALYPTAQTGFTRAPIPLPAVADPGTPASRVDLMFYERGFWMFSTGHRLGDLRRLIRQYGRAPDAVFPTGTYFKGGPFGPAVNMPIPLDEQNNPHFVHCMNTSA